MTSENGKAVAGKITIPVPTPTADLIEAIPDLPAIRSRLTQLMHEQDLLRSLLRMAEHKQAMRKSLDELKAAKRRGKK